MPVDYSKWDKLELSDDEDFECHPNVDKKSMIRWRQAEIYRQRRQRNDKMAILREEQALNTKATTAIQTMLAIEADAPADAHDDAAAAARLEQWTAQLTALEQTCKTLDADHEQAVWKRRHSDVDPRWQPPTREDYMDARPQLLPLAQTIIHAFQPRAAAKDVSGARAALVAARDAAVARLAERNVQAQQDIAACEAEANARLTSENMFHEGFNVTKTNKPSATTVTTTETTIETIHDPSAAKHAASASAAEKSSGGAEGVASSQPAVGEDEDDEEITYAPARAFADLNSLESSYTYLTQHPELANQKYSDMILAEAFRTALRAKTTMLQAASGVVPVTAAARAAAKQDDARVPQLVQQSLLLQYTGLLGKDGIRLFFEKMKAGAASAAPSPNGGAASAKALYYQDCMAMTQRIRDRVQVLASEQVNAEVAERREADALVDAARQPDGTLALPVPPDLEAGEAELFHQRKALFDGLPASFQEGLLRQDVDAINGYFSSLSAEEGARMAKACARVGLIAFEEDGDDDDDDESHAEDKSGNERGEAAKDAASLS
ncbi:hypothetical protein CXG81DRAFT_26827 [Caulochytrium protostelioides]|uniref:Hsp90 chaperone protein kinase-targeting subunit n=1 Tax=Caulochytrium protostelioides TaxID=1555241 RepID=A0A4P9X5S4_9FUNG|nr:hypothetical protein CXG81DRAFT_26827 [Caulochytrium protostelioides]|eukprot:RKP00472.1 hypothetical protein CXG81DRAFT_26827 [Caulochytrium protostelioides]